MCLVMGANFDNHENSCSQTSVLTSCVEKANGEYYYYCPLSHKSSTFRQCVAAATTSTAGALWQLLIAIILRFALFTRTGFFKAEETISLLGFVHETFSVVYFWPPL